MNRPAKKPKRRPGAKSASGAKRGAAPAANAVSKGVRDGGPAGQGAAFTVADGALTFRLPVKPDGIEPLLGAAYLMTDRHFVALGGDRKKLLTVTLWGKETLSEKELPELGALFERELESQRVRWAIARNNLPVREYIQELAVKLAQAPPAPPEENAPGGDDLSEEQRKEIDALIHEVELEIKALKDSPSGADPKGISATWEEKHKG